MLAALLTILSLLVDFYDKVNLFQTPVTRKKKLIIILLITAAIVSIINDWLDNKSEEHSQATIESLNIKSGILRSEITDLRKENKTAQKEYTDSLINYHNYTTLLLARYGLKVDTLKNTIEELDSLSLMPAPITPPTLAMTNPPEYRALNDKEDVIGYTLEALNADVHVLNYYWTLINSKNNKLIGKPEGFFGSSMNFTTIIPAGSSTSNMIFIDRFKPSNFNDTFFLALHFEYKGKNNARQTPVRKIYQVITKQKKVTSVDNYIFNTVAFYLRKYKVWKKFYDL